MRLLHVTTGIQRELGGLTFALEGLLKLEQLLGFDSRVLALEGGDNEHLRALANDVHLEVRSFPSRFANSAGATRWLRKELRRFDLVVLHGAWFMLIHVAAREAARAGVPYVLWSHGSLDPFDLQKKRLAKRLLGRVVMRRTLAQARGVFCTSETEARHLESYGASVRRIVMPLPVDEPSEHGDRLAFRDSMDFSADQPVFLFLGRIDYKKGLNLLLPAFKQLLQVDGRVRLVVAGDTSTRYGQLVLSWVRQLEIGHAVRFVGFIEGREKMDALAGADCFVLPSMNENFGIAVVEALRAGLPVLVTDNVYIWRELSDLGAAYVCSYSVESVVSAMTRAIAEIDHGAERGAAARQAGARFDPSRIACEYGPVVEEIAAKGAGRERG